MYRGLSVNAAGSASTVQQHQPSAAMVTRTHNAHNSSKYHPSSVMKSKLTAGGPAAAMSAAYVSPTMIASAPPVISATPAGRSVPPTGAVSERITRQISGRTDWAAKYLHTSTKYSK